MAYNLSLIHICDRRHERRDGACAVRLYLYARNGCERPETVCGYPSSRYLSLIHISGWQEGDTLTPKGSSITEGKTKPKPLHTEATPVSYTHLDVYKRQSIFMSFRVCRKGNETAYKTYRFPLKGCLLRLSLIHI